MKATFSFAARLRRSPLLARMSGGDRAHLLPSALNRRAWRGKDSLSLREISLDGFSTFFAPR